MNKLILLGNGFDLAHGMKTSYNDFILWYLIKCYTAAYNDGEYKDEALHIIGDKSLPLDIDVGDSVESFINFFYEKNNLGNLVAEKFITKRRSFEYVNPFKTTIKYKLIHTLLSKCTHCNWVEIENEYYEQLKSLLIDQIDFNKSKKEKLDELNKSMTYLICQLEEYLSKEKPRDVNDKYLDILKSHL